MILWIAAKLGTSVLTTKLLLCAAGGLVIFLGIQKYTNYVWDKASAQTRATVTKEIAKTLEKEIAEQRQALKEEGKRLDLKRRIVLDETANLQTLRDETKKALVGVIEKSKKEEAVRYERILGEVKDIPGDKLDDAIRTFLSRYPKAP